MRHSAWPAWTRGMESTPAQREAVDPQSGWGEDRFGNGSVTATVMDVTGVGPRCGLGRWVGWKQREVTCHSDCIEMRLPAPSAPPSSTRALSGSDGRRVSQLVGAGVFWHACQASHMASVASWHAGQSRVACTWRGTSPLLLRATPCWVQCGLGRVTRASCSSTPLTRVDERRVWSQRALLDSAGDGRFRRDQRRVGPAQTTRRAGPRRIEQASETRSGRGAQECRRGWRRAPPTRFGPRGRKLPLAESAGEARQMRRCFSLWSSAHALAPREPLRSGGSGESARRDGGRRSQ